MNTRNAAGASAGDAAPPDVREIALLGPQHRVQSLRGVLESFAGDALARPIALVAAGWEEREAETGALEEHLGCAVRNLGLWPKCEDAFEEDADLKARLFARYDRMRELARIYRLRLSAELDALRALVAEAGTPEGDALVGPAIEVAFDALAELDAHHAARVRDLNERVFEAVCGRDAIRRRADEVRATLDGVGTLLIAGGHVGILYNRLRLFGVLEALPEWANVVGWSAGAMVLTERLVLFHDSPPQGPGNPEVHGPGLGLARGVVALPHASSRLALDDESRVELLVRRFAPSLLVALDDGQFVTRVSGGWRFDGKARTLGPEGSVQTPEDGGVR